MKVFVIVLCATMLIIGLKVQLGRNRYYSELENEAARMRRLQEERRQADELKSPGE